ncbi:DEAD/DEAH box helicase family protein, partial [Pseudomonas aeruginosa]|uniref:DEAD/DEAH box helicase family protein n=1 Tax=Pseudomonas aeruginosa TaxID=287 RepID=UPI0023592699
MLEAVKNYRSRYISIKTVNAIREAMLQYTWLKNTRPVDTNSVPGRLNFKMLDKLTFTPDGSQKAYFENYNYRIDQYGLRGDIVAGKPGTGKTFMTMAIAEMVESDIIIVVCEKKSIDLIWKPSIIEMYKERQKVWSTIDDKAYNGQRILISHYQAQDKIIDLLRSGIFKGKKITVILDESHNMNDPYSAESR